ncbi:unnamed protein product [Rotaria magnacalcarata]|uniref:Uncharacterized protein n=1 Tax=Rotaria magnacalcarata TaxID=392030 RepID=A0A819W782_9BILA|nr:unnamed protein product [Rotaria magnacalcarata]CAF2097451.1 unnamed protein product [Rotaria magnacalcarata]CAF4084239.1 unnamed protein product [Rotaria magnacalcarata]CAF4122020.1 unnamed protein product [Rotaria magnacalcarata]
MLPTQEGFAIQTDILPTQNIGHLERNQPQVYSLLSSSTSCSSIKKPRRKKTTKLQETIPVMINPQITRTSTGVTFGAPHHHSTTIPESISPFVSARLLNSHPLPVRFFIEQDSCDSNNNINHNQTPSLSIPLTSSVSVQTQQNPSWSNDFVSVMNSNALSQMVAESQLFGLNRIFNNKIDEKTASACSTQHNDYKHLSPSFTITPKESPINHFHTIASPLSSVSPTKSKHKQTKRQDSRIFIEHENARQYMSPCPTTFTQSTVSNGLPSIIPTSVTAMTINSDEPSMPMDIQTTTNFIPLTPPASISSIKSPSTNVNNEYCFIPIQKCLLSPVMNNITDANSISQQYYHDQGFSHLQNTTTKESINRLPYNFHRLLADANQKYCMVSSDLKPTNILPIACSATPPILIPSDIQKKRKKREKSIQKSKILEFPIVPMVTEKQALISKTLTTTKSTTIDSTTATSSNDKERNLKLTSKKDIRTKKQLRRISRQNRLAILKFMMRKRKQQKQERISISKAPEQKTEQVVPKLVSPSITNADIVEPHLPDIIAPSLKISFDSAQNIESISLYYHRRRKPDNVHKNSLTNNDNKLSLLLEAVELIETLHGNSKYILPSDK